MGYRTYIGSMPKREYNKIKSMTKDQLIEHYKVEREDYEIEEGYIGMGVYDFAETLYEFGKYTDFEPPKGSQKTFFKNKALNKCFTEEHDFAIVTPDFLKYIIESYEKRVKDYYNEMMTPFFGKKSEERFYRDNPSDFLNSVKVEYNYPNNKYKFDFSTITQDEQNALFEIIEHVRSMRSEWNNLTPYDLEKGSEVTTSWKYEYGIFELVKIYKSFDWKRNVMVYYGY
jgi:uncharacterized ubiquitin-like protein YukD